MKEKFVMYSLATYLAMFLLWKFYQYLMESFGGVVVWTINILILFTIGFGLVGGWKAAIAFLIMAIIVAIIIAKSPDDEQGHQG